MPKSTAAITLAKAALLMHCSTKRMPGTTARLIKTSETAGCSAAARSDAMLCMLRRCRTGMADGDSFKLVSQAAAHAVLV